ncbi:MAG: GTPase HflX [Bacteroidota bacterium]
MEMPRASAAGGNAILVAVAQPRQPQEEVQEHLDELAFLGETAGLTTIATFVQRLEHPDSRTFVGKGKLEEITAYVLEHPVTSVLFDDDLSASQLRNLERAMNPADREQKVRIYDRSLLILDIFVMRAQTAQARAQVQLAMNQYLLPRLTRMWTHLERQRGGTGTRGGAGEKEIETDRRVIKKQIADLKDELEKIDKQRQTQRKGRDRMVRVALVGYTNVGKSTLMNLLSKSDVKAENKLFATVDATVRKVVINHIPFLLSDTVGFIRKLPHHLIESFKSTLDEVREADLLIHVADISHPFHENHIEVVNKTLAEIGAGEIPVILVLNKVDKLNGDAEDLEARAGYYTHHKPDSIVFVSAATGLNISNLRTILFDRVKERFMKIYPNYKLPQYTEDWGSYQ